jgi:hypothetical protein
VDAIVILQAVLNSNEIRLLAALILVDLVTGVAAALKARAFELQRVGEFLVTNVLPFVIVWGGVSAAAWIAPAADFTIGAVTVSVPVLPALAAAAFVAATVALLGSILENVKGLGLNVPLLRPPSD